MFKVRRVFDSQDASTRAQFASFLTAHSNPHTHTHIQSPVDAKLFLFFVATNKRSTAGQSGLKRESTPGSVLPRSVFFFFFFF